MGCDIHLHTEVKIKGTWHHYSCPNVNRHYNLFAKMANVRNNGKIEPISKPRGIPLDAAFLTKFACTDYGMDGHSHSWLNAEEIFILYEEFGCMLDECYSPAFGYFFGNDWDTFWKYRNGDSDIIPEGVEDVRYIFWFDN